VAYTPSNPDLISPILHARALITVEYLYVFAYIRVLGKVGEVMEEVVREEV
jgi:hypothetical protein